MSLPQERALAAALLARLRAEPALSSLLGAPARVYDEPPSDPTYPFLQVGRVQARSWGGASGDEAEGLEHVITLTCVSRFGGAEEARAVTAAVRAVLHDADLALDGARLVSLRCAYADVFRAADWRSTYGVVRLRAVTEPLDDITGA